ncbi:hypothetical protein X975_02458, partial [Stegodyphus mimosarum]
MNIKYMLQYVFSSCELLVKSMNLMRRTRYAVPLQKERKHVDKDKTEQHGGKDNDNFCYITTVIYGEWCKRSYGHASVRLSVIIGKATQKILCIGVRNKVCLICMSVEQSKIKAKEHFSSKN